jgi:CRP/FNR family transcriptional regulator
MNTLDRRAPALHRLQPAVARFDPRFPVAASPINPAPRLLAEFKRAVLLNGLRRCKLFSEPPSVNLEQVASFTVMKLVARGDYLFHQGTPAEGFYIVQRGAIKLYRVTHSGKEQVIHMYRPHESFAEEMLVSEQGHLTEARATEESQVLLVKKREFLALLKGQPDLALRVLRAMDRHLCLLVELLDDLKLKDIKTRVANWLVQQCPDSSSSEPWVFQLPTTKRMLASELGTVSETLSRTLAKLRDQKFLTVVGQTITLLCPVRLAQFARGNSAPDLTPSLGALASHSAFPQLRPPMPLFVGRSGRFPAAAPRTSAVL